MYHPAVGPFPLLHAEPGRQPDLAGAILTVDLAAIAENYALLARTAGPATCAAVVKADAYGLGAHKVAPALLAAGCRDFFVAHVEEGMALRAVLGAGPRIGVLHGAPPRGEEACLQADLVPVLNDDGQRSAWQRLARRTGRSLPAILQVDTGMARFGYAPDELLRVLDDAHAFAGLTLQAVMSHLACADAPEHPANAAQLQTFTALRRHLPGVPGSLAASSGIFLGADYRAELVRPGAALYGVNPQPGRPNPMRPVVRLQGRVMQLRTVAAGTPVGYGHRGVTAAESRLATVAVGYADGFSRAASGHGEAWLGTSRLPIVGRVSMDSIVVDATAVEASAIAPGTLVDIIGPHRDLDAVAQAAGTIGYEVLTSLGHRFHRIYLGA